MTKSRWFLTYAAVMAGVASLAVATDARAEGGLTLEERLERLERKGEQPAGCCDTSALQHRLDRIEAHIKNLPFGLKLGGGIATSYKYDFNDPDSKRISLRSFDQDHNSFVLDLFQLQIARAPGDDGVGFVTKVDFGKLAERLGTDWDGDGTSGNVAEEQNSVDLQEAYLTYNFPGLPALQLKAGKFATPIGAEVIEPWANPNVSRSLAFSWAAPFTHAGATLSYAFGTQASLMLGVVNGWDNVVDSNDGKSLVGSLGLTPVESLTFLINGTYGAEQPDRGDSKRGLLDLVATIKPVENFAAILNYDYGNESDLDVGGDTEWNAFSGILAYDLVDALPVPVGVALRGEYFDDSDGTRLPTPNGGGFGNHQSAWEVTTTFKVVLAEGLMFRTEYRYDKGQHQLYEKSLVGDVDDYQNDQHTVAAELSYVF
ncbi:MAG: porin [Deltaproteobacteria bacterium]|nr:porin [Deltaproteobacteria bacterium]